MGRQILIYIFIDIKIFFIFYFFLQGALHHMLVSPPTDPPTDPISTPSTLPFPHDEVTYNNNLQRNKCNLLTGNNTLAIVSTVHDFVSAINY